MRSCSPSSLTPHCFVTLLSPATQVNGAATEPELYQFVMQSFRAFEQAVFSKVVNEDAAYRRRRDDAELAGEGAGQHPHQDKTPQPQEIADAMASVMQDETVPQFSNLKEVVDR